MWSSAYPCGGWVTFSTPAWGRLTVRAATADDAAAVAAIYGPVVADTAISFEIDPPTAEEVARRIAAGSSTHPWLVAEAGGEVLGYAYAGVHRARPAYRWTVETSLYVAADARGLGVGTALYSDLIARLRAAGFVTALAGITLPNPASVALHERMGFVPAGVFRDVGHKFERWYDVGWWRLALVPPPDEPVEPSPAGSR